MTDKPMTWRAYHDWEEAAGEDYYIGPSNNGSLDRAIARKLSMENADRIVRAQNTIAALMVQLASAETRVWEEAAIAVEARADELMPAVKATIDGLAALAAEAEASADNARREGYARGAVLGVQAMPDEALVGLVMHLTSGQSHPDVIRTQITKWRAEIDTKKETGK